MFALVSGHQLTPEVPSEELPDLLAKTKLPKSGPEGRARSSGSQRAPVFARLTHRKTLCVNYVIAKSGWPDHVQQSPNGGSGMDSITGQPQTLRTVAESTVVLLLR